MKTFALLSALLLAACPLQTQKSLTLGPGGSSGGGSSGGGSSGGGSSGSSPAGGGASDDSGVPTAEESGRQGQSNLDASTFLRAEFEALKGMPIDKAKAYAKSRGHTGEVALYEEDHFIDGCKDGIVCYATDERGGEAGMGNGDKLLLHINKKLSISGPPE